jgi:hypothetical protein
VKPIPQKPAEQGEDQLGGALQTFVEWTATMLAVASVSYLVARLAALGSRGRTIALPFAPDQRLKLVAPGGAYRSRFVRESREGIIVQAPLHRDSYVPLREGTEVVVQAPHQSGLVTFRSKILRRLVGSHEFVLARPGRIRNTERRSEPRLTPEGGLPADLNGRPASVINVSAGGARIVTLAAVDPGDFVSLSSGEFEGTATGFVLEAAPAVWQNLPAVEARVWFEDPFAGLTRPSRSGPLWSFQKE